MTGSFRVIKAPGVTDIYIYNLFDFVVYSLQRHFPAPSSTPPPTVQWGVFHPPLRQFFFTCSTSSPLPLYLSLPFTPPPSPPTELRPLCKRSRRQQMCDGRHCEQLSALISDLTHQPAPPPPPPLHFNHSWNSDVRLEIPT